MKPIVINPNTGQNERLFVYRLGFEPVNLFVEKKDLQYE